MSILTYAQLKGVWLKASQGTKYHTNGWATLMAAIAMAESQGKTNALNPNDNGGRQSSFGLWQISTGTHSPPSPNWDSPSVNAKLAVNKLKSEGLGAWGTYATGAYRKYLNGKVPPDTSGSASGGNATLTGFSASGSLFSGVLGALGLGSAKDAFIRLGLILLGAALVIVGVITFAGKGTAPIIENLLPKTKAVA